MTTADAPIDFRRRCSVLAGLPHPSRVELLAARYEHVLRAVGRASTIRQAREKLNAMPSLLDDEAFASMPPIQLEETHRARGKPCAFTGCEKPAQKHSRLCSGHAKQRTRYGIENLRPLLPPSGKGWRGGTSYYAERRRRKASGTFVDMRKRK